MTELEFRLAWRNIRKQFGVPAWATGWDSEKHRWEYMPRLRPQVEPPTEQEIKSTKVVKMDRKLYAALRSVRDGR